MTLPSARQHRSVQANGTGSASLAYSSNVVSGNPLVVGGASWQQPFDTGSCTDSQGNTYTREVPSTGTDVRGAFYTAIAGSSAANTVSVDPSGTADDVTIIIYEVEEINTSSMVLDVTNNTGSGTSLSSGTLDTTGFYNSFLIVFFGHDSGGSPTPSALSSGWTSDELQTNTADIPLQAVSRVGEAATTYTATETWGGSGLPWFGLGLALKANDQTPPPSPTKVYFPATDTPTGGITPSFAAWTSTGAAVRRKLAVGTKGSSTNAEGTLQSITSGSGNSTLDRQYISDELAAGIAFDTSWTIKGQLLAREPNANDNVNAINLCIKVVSSDGSTLRGTLLSLNNYGTTTELSTALRNKTIADGDALTGSYTTVAGDRLVIEIGPRMTTTGTSPQAAIQYGEANSELAENETATSGSGWIEFSKTITLNSGIVIAGTIASVSTVASAVSLTKGLSGSIDGVTSLATALSLTKLLFGSIDAVSTVNVVIPKVLQGQIDGTSTLAAVVSLTKFLSGSVDTVSTVSTALSLTKFLSGSIDATSTVSAEMYRYLSGLIAGDSSITANAALAQLIGGTIAGTSAISADMYKYLSGSIDAVSTISSALSLSKFLSGQMSFNSTITAEIYKYLIGSIDGVSLLSADLSVGGAPGVVDIRGVIAAESSIAAQLSLTKYMSGLIEGQTVQTAHATVLKSIAGHVDGNSTLSASVLLDKYLSGVIAGQSEITAHVVLTHLLQGLLENQSMVTVSPSILRPVQGHIESLTTINGTISLARLLSGIINGQADLTGHLSLTKSIGGTIQAISIVGMNLQVTVFTAKGSVVVLELPLASLSGVERLLQSVTPDEGLIGSITVEEE